MPPDHQGVRGVPILDWLFAYRKEWLRGDVMAGLITAAVVIPKAMAYATIAGLPVQVGLYTAFVPMVMYALAGTSRPLSVSTTTTLAILLASELGQVAPGGDPAALLSASCTLSLMVGLVLLLAALLRLGFFANFISEPVLVGFKAGIALVIILDQVPKLLGVHIAKGGFLHNLLVLAQALPETSIPTLAVGAAMLLLLLGLEHFVPKAPAPLVAVAAGIAAVILFNLEGLGVATIGQIPRGLPSFTPPDLALAEGLWPAALGIALMSFTESIAAGRAFAGSEDPPLRPNQELLATGLANAGGALFGAMPAGGGTSQTAVNRRAGAHSQLAGLLTAAATLLTMLFLAPLMGRMPQATLAAVVIVYSIGLFQPSDFRAIRRVRRMEFLWAMAAMVGVVLLGTLKGIIVAIILSLVGLSHQVADPPVRVLARKRGTNVFRPRSGEHPDDETFAGLLILRPEGRIFFVNAQRIADKIKRLVEESAPAVVAIDLSGVPDLEYTALKMLAEGEEKLRARGIRLWLVGLNPEVLAVIQHSPLGGRLGREGLHFSLELALENYLSAAGRPRPVEEKR